jgi:hypothetical protein
MNNVVFWNINPQFVLHKRHIEVSTAVTMKNVVFWDMKTQFLLHRRNITSTL